MLKFLDSDDMLIDEVMIRYSEDEFKLSTLSKETMLRIVKIAPSCLRFFTDNEKLDQEICLTAIDKNKGELDYILPDRIYDEKFIKSILKSSYSNIEYIPEKFITKDLLVDVIKISRGDVLRFIPKPLLNEEILQIGLKEIEDKQKSYAELLKDLCK